VRMTVLELAREEHSLTCEVRQARRTGQVTFFFLHVLRSACHPFGCFTRGVAGHWDGSLVLVTCLHFLCLSFFSFFLPVFRPSLLCVLSWGLVWRSDGRVVQVGGWMSA